jgi:hypothetical protein
MGGQMDGQVGGQMGGQYLSWIDARIETHKCIYVRRRDEKMRVEGRGIVESVVRYEFC